MKSSKQISLIPRSRMASSFGGELNKGKRKTARPIATKFAMHIVIKSDRMIFIRKLKQHRLNLQKISKLCGVNLIEFQFNGNHVHIVARFYHREAYFRFIRMFTGLLAFTTKVKGLFPHRPFTRFVKWGRDLENMRHYVQLNEFESDGISKAKGRVVLAQMALGPP